MFKYGKFLLFFTLDRAFQLLLCSRGNVKGCPLCPKIFLGSLCSWILQILEKAWAIHSRLLKSQMKEDQLKIPNPKQWRICWAFGLCVGNGEVIPINSDCSHWCCSAQLIPKTCRKPVGSELMWELLQREDQNSNTLGESNSLKQNYSGRFCLLSLYPNNQVQRGGCPKLKNVGDAAFFLPLNEIKASQLIFSRIFSH